MMIELTQSRLKDVLTYDPETGDFTWLVRKSSNAVLGSQTSSATNSSGYRRITVDGRRYRAHRLAWLYVHGEWPSDQIDHINGNRDDNRIANLRVLPQSNNIMNGPKRSDAISSKYRGVDFCPSKKGKKQWRARFKRRHLGWFRTEEEAYVRYLVELKKLAEQIDLPRHPYFSQQPSGESAYD